ncbi:MAG TPA: hypothetical protein VLH60_07975 [Sedimentisphaerales bacterium]|nr:hypothetical protein [Sedimentisphaerales bacterium]
MMLLFLSLAGPICLTTTRAADFGAEGFSADWAEREGSLLDEPFRRLTDGADASAASAAASVDFSFGSATFGGTGEGGEGGEGGAEGAFGHDDGPAGVAGLPETGSFTGTGGAAGADALGVGVSAGRSPSRRTPLRMISDSSGTPSNMEDTFFCSPPLCFDIADLSC